MEEIKQYQSFQQQNQFNRIITQNTKQLLKKYINEEINMSQFEQSVWENTNIPRKEHQQSREGDWICIKCNNLNFSFRKRCNRCKLQTREENEEQIRQAYQYYQNYYRQFDPQQCQEPQTLNHNEPSEYNHLESHEFALQNGMEDGSDQQCWGVDLPSVSPIMKRYKKQKTTPKTQISQAWSSDQQSSEGSQYLQKYCWQNIMIEDDVENEYSGRDNYDGWDSEIEKLVQNIVL